MSARPTRRRRHAQRLISWGLSAVTLPSLWLGLETPESLHRAFPFLPKHLVARVAAAQEIDFVETFALAPDRSAVLDRLVPGTEPHYYYHALVLQQAGKLDEVPEILKQWESRHGRTGLWRRIFLRQTLLSYPRDHRAALDTLQLELGLSFDHQRTPESSRPDLPVSLDPNSVSWDAFYRRAISGTDSVDGLTDAGLAQLLQQDADPDSPARRRSLLARLTSPTHPEVLDWIIADLAVPEYPDFGSLPIHRQLYLAQLEQLRERDPRIVEQTAFVETYLTKLWPGADVDPQRDHEQMQAYLARLESFVVELPPVYNSLKAHVLYHRLQFDRQQGRHDRDRFLAYLQLPRHVGYMLPEYLGKPELTPFPVDLNGDFSAFTRLPSVGDDESLVRNYLDHFLVEADDIKAFSPYVREDYLNRRLAEVKILAGLGDTERWASLLPPADFQALKERIDLDFAPNHPQRFGPNDDVSLELDIKNVETLLIKVYEIQPKNYYEQEGSEINTDIALDGLVANHERTVKFDVGPLRRVRRKFDFPELAQPGVYVIDFIGNGRSSRVLVRKGRLHYTVSTSAGGQQLTVFNDADEPLSGAVVRLGGREFITNEAGQALIPFSTAPGRVPILLSHGRITTLESFQHEAESYTLLAGIHVDRESLLRGRQATVLLRPVLQLNGQQLPIGLLEETTLTIVSTDIDGISTTKEMRPFELFDDREASVSIQIPPRLASVAVTLSGKVKSLSEDRKIDLSTSYSVTINGIERRQSVDSVHLSRNPEGYFLEVLGRTGEVRADRPVTVSVKHRDFHAPLDFTLKSDAKGRVSLGALPRVEWITVNDSDGVVTTWPLNEDRVTSVAVRHALEGEAIEIPYAGTASEPTRSAFALHERNAATYVADRFDAINLIDGAVRIEGLTRGDYELEIKETGQRVAIRVTAGKRVGEFALGSSRKLQAPQTSGVRIAELTQEDRRVRIRVAGGSETTRVHLYATRYAPRFDAFPDFNRVRGNEPYWMSRPDAPNVFQSGRTLGEEYRYILDRRYATKYPGMMLERPSLLLNPWAVRTTETGQQQAQAGDEFAAGAAPAPAEMEAMDARQGEGGILQDDASLDFLAFGSTLVANAVPNDGWVEIELPEGLSKHWITAVAVDDRTTAIRTTIAAETASPNLDLRLAEALDQTESFVQRRQVQTLRAGDALEMAIGSSRFQSYDSVASAFTLLQTLSNDQTLPSFRFIANWPKLSAEEKRAKYSEFACHELSVFLYHRDRPFFDEVIRPYLANKREKTFVDRWLLGENLDAYREAWAYAQLNTFERVLLAKRVAEETAEVRRALQHAYELAPLSRDEFQRLFEVAVKGFSMDAGLLAEELRLADESLAFNGVPATNAPGSGPEGGYGMGGMGGLGGGGMGGGMAMGDAPAPPPGMPQGALRRRAGAAEPASEEALSRGARQLNRDADRYALGLESAERKQEKALAERALALTLFRQVDKTQEWAENHWYHRPLESLTPDLIGIDGFWLDYVLHDGETGFMSHRIAEASNGLSEVLLALAISDLPFEAPQHETKVEDDQVKLTAAGPTIVYHEQIRPALPADENAPPVLVGQNFFRLDDRYRYEGNEQLDKFVTDEFLVHVVYGGRIAVTNPTSTPRKLDVLLQIPEGAIPVLSSKETRSLPLDLGPYQTITLEYHFYFPATGDFDHYPVQISSGERKLAAAEPFRFHVVKDATIIDRTSWEWVSQYGTEDQVFEYLEQHNPLRLDLSRIAFRMRDQKFFQRAIAELSRRRLFEPTLWSYGVLHDHVPTVREYFQFRDDLVNSVGPTLESDLLSLDPERRRTYEHLDYRPLVNARAHRLGANRRILNDRFHAQYHRLMEILALRPQLDADDKLAVVYYLLLQDRYEEAIAMFESVPRDSVTTTLQYDLFDAWLDMIRERPERAREIAAKYVDHPVDRWRDTFRALVAQVDELNSGAVAIVDQDDRLQSQTAAAAATASFDFVVESKRIELTYRNLESVTVNFYRMDVETLFSRDPFVQSVSGRFSHIRPNETLEVELSKDESKRSIELPESLRTANVIVEIVAGGETRSQAYYSHALDLQIQEEFGQIQVRHVDGQVLPKTYVKVYARMQDGQIRFYKDGYTDLRGRFDFASLSTNELDFVERFSILVSHDEHGSAVRETNPPQR